MPSAMTIEPCQLTAGLNSYFDQSRISLTLADATQPDLPLVLANPAFVRMSGYALADVVGRNCRFLQPASGAGPVVARMRAFLDDPARGQERFLIVNERKSGEPFLNLVFLAKIRQREELTYILGSQFDVTRFTRERADLFDRALRNDLRAIAPVLGGAGGAFVGTYDVLASSAALIAKAKLVE